MNDVTMTGAAVAGTKTLWAAVGVLGAAVLGLGGALYYTQAHKTDETQLAAPVATVAPAVPVAVAVKEAPAKPPVAEKPAAAKPRVVHAKTAKLAPVAATAAPVEAPPPVAVRPICVDCATVTAVTPVEREGESGGTGAVAGGVLGALVGNQFGRGQGKDVATIIGAIGGGIAGNQVEKKMKKVTAYQVDLRMDDGSRRTMELATPVAVGERVRLDGGTLQPLPAGY